MTRRNATKVRIGAKDAAVVLRGDGSVEAVLPTSATPAPNTLVAEALLWAAGDERTLERILSEMEAEEDSMASRAPH